MKPIYNYTSHISCDDDDDDENNGVEYVLEVLLYFVVVDVMAGGTPRAVHSLEQIIKVSQS